MRIYKKTIAFTKSIIILMLKNLKACFPDSIAKIFLRTYNFLKWSICVHADKIFLLLINKSILIWGHWSWIHFVKIMLKWRIMIHKSLFSFLFLFKRSYFMYRNLFLGVFKWIKTVKLFRIVFIWLFCWEVIKRIMEIL